MKKEELSKLKLNELKDLAKEKDLKVTGLKKDEIIQRSLGQGMFMRIQKYKMLNKKNPFKLIISSLEPGNINNNEKEKKISQTNSFKKKI